MSRRKVVAPVAPALPDYRADHAAADALGLTVMTYHNHAVGGMWVPRDLVGTRTLVRWTAAADNAYGFDGWTVMDGRSTGGPYETLSGALGWIKWHRAQLAEVAA